MKPFLKELQEEKEGIKRYRGQCTVHRNDSQVKIEVSRMSTEGMNRKCQEGSSLFSLFFFFFLLKHYLCVRSSGVWDGGAGMTSTHADRRQLVGVGAFIPPDGSQGFNPGRQV